MIAERLLSQVMRRAGDRYMRLSSYSETKRPAARTNRHYMLYVHIPFCSRLCPYCSFNRYLFDPDLARAYFERLRKEMRAVSGLGYDFGSMYVGGGTPTVMVDELCDTIDLARELFSIREVSSETNPDHLIPEVVDPLVERVQRFSVGVQSFDDTLLEQMDRLDKYGSGEEIMERLEWVRGKFHSLNVDMIFNFPSQTEEMLLRDVDLVRACGSNQVTFYPLMASPAVAESLGKTIGRVDYSREHHYYQMLSDALSSDFEPASAWTFSRLGGGMIDEYIVDYEEYVGLGSGAFSFVDGTLYVNTFSLVDYVRAVDAGRTPVAKFRKFPRRDRMRYTFLMSLFGLELDRQRFQEAFGVDVERGLPLETTFLKAAGGFDVCDRQRMTLTPVGRYLLVVMMRQFFVSVNNLRDQARAALPPEERRVLFGDESEACSPDHPTHPLAAAVAETQSAEDAPVPR